MYNYVRKFSKVIHVHVLPNSLISDVYDCHRLSQDIPHFYVHHTLSLNTPLPLSSLAGLLDLFLATQLYQMHVYFTFSIAVFYFPGACFSRVNPLPLKNPYLVASSHSALSKLGLSETEVSRPELVEYFCGNKLLPGSQPAAHCYCGHQFGHFSGQLGDGCAQ